MLSLLLETFTFGVFIGIFSRICASCDRVTITPTNFCVMIESSYSYIYQCNGDNTTTATVFYYLDVTDCSGNPTYNVTFTGSYVTCDGTPCSDSDYVAYSAIYGNESCAESGNLTMGAYVTDVCVLGIAMITCGSDDSVTAYNCDGETNTSILTLTSGDCSNNVTWFFDCNDEDGYTTTDVATTGDAYTTTDITTTDNDGDAGEGYTTTDITTTDNDGNAGGGYTTTDITAPDPGDSGARDGYKLLNKMILFYGFILWFYFYSY